MSERARRAWSLENLQRSFLLLLGLFGVPRVAFAQFNLSLAKGVGLRGGLEQLIAGFIRITLGLVGVVALAFIIYGGFLYITAHGDERQLEQAKNVLTFAIIGIIVIGLAWAAVSFVLGAFGAS